MKEFNFGSLARRELTLRFFTPSSMERWTGDELVFAPWRLLSVQAWRRAIFSRWNWELWWGLFREGNHRCYCCSGTMFDGRICVAGFSVVWFYSRYCGPVPCPCDQVIAELFPEEAENAG